MKLFNLLNFLFLFSILSYGQGLIMNQEEFDALEKYDPSEEMGFASGNLPSRVSYRNFTPFPGHQGKTSTCTGWAVAYGQLTTQQNLQMGITNRIQRSARAMDPNFLYSFLREYNDEWCKKGTSMKEAMNVLLNIGCKPLYAKPWIKCNTVIKKEDISLLFAKPYIINDYMPINPTVENMKVLLNNGYIISGGFLTDDRFMSESTVNTGKWTFSGPLDPEGAHAMCIVGYDDNKYGGAFEILNSYSAEFGDNGYVWLSYRDFVKTTFQTWIIDIPGFRRSGSCLYGDCSSNYSIFITKDGDYYEGIVENNYPNIYGTKYLQSGSFYVGGWKNGYEHGSGLMYDIKTNKYYNVAFKMGELVSFEDIQGFASPDDSKNIEELYNQMNSKVPGELVSPESQDYEDFINNYEMSEEPVVIKKD